MGRDGSSILFYFLLTALSISFRARADAARAQRSAGEAPARGLAQLNVMMQQDAAGGFGVSPNSFFSSPKTGRPRGGSRRVVSQALRDPIAKLSDSAHHV